MSILSNVVRVFLNVTMPCMSDHIHAVNDDWGGTRESWFQNITILNCSSYTSRYRQNWQVIMNRSVPVVCGIMHTQRNTTSTGMALLIVPCWFSIPVLTYVEEIQIVYAVSNIITHIRSWSEFDLCIRYHVPGTRYLYSVYSTPRVIFILSLII